MLRLHPHPDCTPPSIAIEAEAVREGSDGLRLHYVVSGDVGSLLLPAPAPPVRADGLWQHSCFEAFVLAGEGPGYHEINLSPSSAWAAYAFAAYREGMENAAIPPPAVETSGTRARFELTARISGLPSGDWRLNLSAVIETCEGSKSWWALAHPPGRADFHNSAAFRLSLPAA
ncbi:MAG: DOMON-like domain-containing protein [Alphaproteobacteria bacterium]|nr:MAG: DOMON-like domain-containing protein [Alphaproteobacteria bacterium]